MTTTWDPLPQARIPGGDIGPADPWTLSDLRTDTVRSQLAEHLVARAVGADLRPRVEWDACDVLTPDGLRLEVRSGVSPQTGERSTPSAVVFSGRTWSPEEGYGAAACYNADGYVFAVLTAREHARYDALDLDQWSFWVLPVGALAATGQRSIRLCVVEALAGPPVRYADLARHVREVVPAG